MYIFAMLGRGNSGEILNNNANEKTICKSTLFETTIYVNICIYLSTIFDGR